jgi:hypothetical protein
MTVRQTCFSTARTRALSPEPATVHRFASWDFSAVVSTAAVWTSWMQTATAAARLSVGTAGCGAVVAEFVVEVDAPPPALAPPVFALVRLFVALACRLVALVVVAAVVVLAAVVELSVALAPLVVFVLAVAVALGVAARVVGEPPPHAVKSAPATRTAISVGQGRHVFVRAARDLATPLNLDHRTGGRPRSRLLSWTAAALARAAIRWRLGLAEL